MIQKFGNYLLKSNGQTAFRNKDIERWFNPTTRWRACYEWITHYRQEVWMMPEH